MWIFYTVILTIGGFLLFRYCYKFMIMLVLLPFWGYRYAYSIRTKKKALSVIFFIFWTLVLISIVALCVH